MLGCSGSNSTTEYGSNSTLEFVEHGLSSPKLESRQELSGSAWRVVNGQLSGEWHRIPLLAKVDLDLAIVSIDDYLLAVVRTTNGGEEVALYFFDASTEAITRSAPSGAEWRTG